MSKGPNAAELEITIITLLAVQHLIMGEAAFQTFLEDREDDQYRWFIFTIFRGSKDWKERYLEIVVPQLRGMNY